MQLLVEYCINSVATAMPLFMLSAAFTLVFCNSRVFNFANGSLYLIGAQIGLLVTNSTHHFWLAILVAALSGAGLGILIGCILLYRMHDNEFSQMLLTLGIALLFQNIIWLYMNNTDYPDSLLYGRTKIGEFQFSSDSLLIIAIGIIVFCGIQVILKRTLIGAQIRAVGSDSQISESLGINITQIRLLAFSAGGGLAALGGAASSLFGTAPSLGASMTLLTLIVIIIGQLGSIGSIFRASLIISFLSSLANILENYFQGVSATMMFLTIIAAISIRIRKII